MSETIFNLYEIAFYPVGNQGKTSLQTYDTLNAAKSAFLDVTKSYLKESLNLPEETRFVVCAEDNPDIKRNHKVYPTDSIVIVQRDDVCTVFEKKTIVNAGYIYNSESHRVNQLGTISITPIKLSPCLIQRIENLKEKEKNLEMIANETNKRRLHAIQLMHELTQDKADCAEREERLANREAFLNQREKMLTEWDADLEEWESNLEKKSNEIHKQIVGYQTEITILEEKLNNLQNQSVIPKVIQSESESEPESEEEWYDIPPSKKHVPPPPQRPAPQTPSIQVTHAQGPVQTQNVALSYLEELEYYLTNKWGKIEANHNEENDSSYLKYIESVINPGKKKVVFGKVKND